MPNYVMVIDQNRCIGCMACIVSCKAENDVPLGNHRTRVVEQVEGTFPNLRAQWRSELCHHCDNPPCVYNCPTRASYKDRVSSTVQLRKSRCVGCKACVAACPYDARYMNHDTGIVDKCTFCPQRFALGLSTACATTCIGKSRVFGDLDDPDSEVSQLLRRHPHHTLLPSAGTRPRIYYISRYGSPQ